MSLLDIQDDPNYVNANEATRRAIFEQYARDDENYTTANAATQAAIRQQFGIADAQTSTATGQGLPQATTALRNIAPEIGQVAMGAGKMAYGSAEDAVKLAKIVGSRLTPEMVGYAIAHPLEVGAQQLDAYIAGHPWMDKALQTTPKQAVKSAGNFLGRVGSGLVQGAVAPESLFAAPYQMAAYEQEKIRANPTAPEYATTPYAQMYRGEYATQGAAGAANRRNAIAGQQYGGLTPEEQALLTEDRIAREIRRKAASNVLGPVAPRGM
jgi:hypothetical protein